MTKTMFEMEGTPIVDCFILNGAGSHVGLQTLVDEVLSNSRNVIFEIGAADGPNVKYRIVITRHDRDMEPQTVTP